MFQGTVRIEAYVGDGEIVCTECAEKVLDAWSSPEDAGLSPLFSFDTWASDEGESCGRCGAEIVEPVETDDEDIDDEDIDDEDDARVAIFQAWIDSGIAWRLEGSVGREAHRLIEEGYCALGPERVTDYWGNTVPAASDIEDGFPGSISYRDARHPLTPGS